MDKLYIENNGNKKEIKVPEFGKVTLFIQDGKILRLEKIITEQLQKKD